MAGAITDQITYQASRMHRMHVSRLAVTALTKKKRRPLLGVLYDEVARRVCCIAAFAQSRGILHCVLRRQSWQNMAAQDDAFDVNAAMSKYDEDLEREAIIVRLP